MTRKTQVVHLLFFLAVLFGLNWSITRTLNLPSGDASIWFHAGLLMLILGMYWIEPYFTKPADVVINGLVVFIAASTLNSPPFPEWWLWVRVYSVGLTVLAFLVVWVGSPALPEYDTSMFKRVLYGILIRIGKAQVLYTLVFFLALVSFLDLKTFHARLLVAFWGIIIAAKYVDIEGLVRSLSKSRRRFTRDAIGSLTHFVDPNIARFTIFKGNACRKGSIVAFSDGPVPDKNSPLAVVTGHRTDLDLVEVEAVVLASNFREGETDNRRLVLLVDPEEANIRERLEAHGISNTLDKIIGFAARNTDIQRLFIDLSRRVDLEEGYLVMAQLPNKQYAYYQAINARLDKEPSIQSNTRAFTIGEAQQLGTWNLDRQGFDTYSWVVPENAPVFRVTADIIVETILKEDVLQVGHVPNSGFPVNVNLKELVLYHTAILGVTGSGKSFLAYQLIEECAKDGIKVVCLDITGDYKRYLRNSVLLNKKGALEVFLDAETPSIGIIEFQDAVHPIIAARSVAQRTIKWCEANRKEHEVKEPMPKVLVVLEEAHTLVPEWGANPDKKHQDVVVETAKIVLQARKYGLGFLIVTQRTANVTKSILNQCNTIFAFQAFDETGFDFMKNYMGIQYVQALPNLKKRQGVVVGKASLSDRPIIVRFQDQEREISTEAIQELEVPSPPAVG